MTNLKLCVGNTDMFPVLRTWDFYNHAGVSPLPKATAGAIADYLWHSQAASYVNSGWHAALEPTRKAAAELIGADASEVAFTKNTSEGLSIVANALDWKAGDVIVTTNVEYPANMYPWMNVAQRFGVKVVAVAEETDAAGRRAVPLGKLLEAIARPGVRLVAISHVEFGSGQRHDLAAIGAACRAKGALFLVDAIQSLGAVPVDVKQMQIDYLACGGQKWLLSPEGTGIFYCRKELLETTRPLTIGAWNVVNAMDFVNYDFTLRSDAGRFESGGQNIAGLLGMRQSLNLLVSLGTEAVAKRVKEIGDRLIAGLEAKGFGIASPREGEQWSGIVSLTLPKGHSAGTPEELGIRLRKERHVEIVARHGRIRVSPHFYNSDEQMDRLVRLMVG